MGGVDWVASSLGHCMYAVERVQEVPSTGDAALEASLRDRYRRQHLLAVAPDLVAGKKAGEAPGGEWTQLIGASYDRRIYGFQIQTTADEDEGVMCKVKDSRKERDLHLPFCNCGD